MDEKSADDQGKIDWREHHNAQPYAVGKRSYEDFIPAYRTAEAAFETHAGKKFEEIEDDLALGWTLIQVKLIHGVKCVQQSNQPGTRLGAVISPRAVRGIRRRRFDCRAVVSAQIAQKRRS